MTHPRYGIEKEYEVHTLQNIQKNHLEQMKLGKIDDGDFLSNGNSIE
jgi:16S rRNA U516 pseudouridylate synthase RsuA-like enzyme